MSEYQINDTGLPHDITISGTDLSEEDKKKLEKQKTNEDIQNYYKKEEKSEEKPALNQIEDKKAKLMKTAEDIQKYYDNNPGEHMELKHKDIPNDSKDFKTIIKDEIEKLKQTLAPKLEAMEKEVEEKKQQKEIELNANQKAEEELAAEVEKAKEELNAALKAGSPDVAEKDYNYEVLKQRLETLRAMNKAMQEEDLKIKKQKSEEKLMKAFISSENTDNETKLNDLPPETALEQKIHSLEKALNQLKQEYNAIINGRINPASSHKSASYLHNQIEKIETELKTLKARQDKKSNKSSEDQKLVKYDKPNKLNLKQ